MKPPFASAIIGRGRLAVLLELEKASLEFEDAARAAAALGKDAALVDVTAAHTRWIAAQDAWRQAVADCRKTGRGKVG